MEGFSLKKVRPVLLFILGSILILVVASLFYWNYYQENPEGIEHLRLEEWSQPAQVASNISTSAYDLLFSEKEYSLFTIEDDDQRTIKQTKSDYNGEVQETTEIVRADQLGSPEAISYLEEDYLFYFAGTSSSNQNLMAKNLNDPDSSITLRENISYPGSLTAVEANDILILAYIERDQELGQNVIKTKAYDELNGEEIFNNTYTREHGVFFPKLTSIEDEIFLAWQERNPDRMFISGQQDRFNRYLLNLGQLDIETGELEKTAELGEAFGDNANIDTSGFNDQLWVSWVKYDSDTESQIVNTGYLDNAGEFQNYSSIPGFNPSILIDDEKVVVHSQELETRGQAGLFINQSSEETGFNNKRIFPAFYFSSNSKIIDYENEHHLFWTEPASTGADIYYSNTIEPEETGIIQLIGLNTIESPMELLSSLSIYFFYPIAGFTMGMANILAPVLIVMLILYLLSKKFSGFKNLTNDTPLISFAGIVLGIIAFNLFVQGDLQYILFLNQPPTSQIPIIIGFVTVVSLGFMYFLNYDRDHSLYIGIGSALLWFYWLYQAALVYDLHSYFI